MYEAQGTLWLLIVEMGFSISIENNFNDFGWLFS